MPLQELSLADTSIDDQGYQVLARMFEDISERYCKYCPADTEATERDFYMGGMSLNLSKNLLSLDSFASFSRLIQDF